MQNEKPTYGLPPYLEAMVAEIAANHDKVFQEVCEKLKANKYPDLPITLDEFIRHFIRLDIEENSRKIWIVVGRKQTEKKELVQLMGVLKIAWGEEHPHQVHIKFETTPEVVLGELNYETEIQTT